MKLIERLPKYEIMSLGEFRMGCEAYGLRIRTGYGIFDFMIDMPVLIGSDNWQKVIEESCCGEYIKVDGAFDTFILKCSELRASVYKTTINTSVIDDRDWGEGGEWTVENVIYGSQRQHINTFKNHIYLQFPFVDQGIVNKMLGDYKALRVKQIAEAVACI